MDDVLKRNVGIVNHAANVFGSPYNIEVNSAGERLVHFGMWHKGDSLRRPVLVKSRIVTLDEVSDVCSILNKISDWLEEFQ